MDYDEILEISGENNANIPDAVSRRKFFRLGAAGAAGAAGLALARSLRGQDKPAEHKPPAQQPADIKTNVDEIKAIRACVLALSFTGWTAPQATDVGRLLPAAAELPGWISGGPPERYEREGLYRYINGGSEIFLQYDFRRVDVGRYKKGDGGAGQEVTVDLYRMDSPLDAFGIFSIRREGGEKTLGLEGVPHWVSESQASLAAGVYYVNIIGFGTQNEEMAVFARLLSKKLTAAGERPFALTGALGPWSAFPREGLLNDTLRIVKGKLAAQEESEILAPDFWNFAGGTVAASAKYGPDGRKIIVVDFAAEPDGIGGDVRSVFKEYLVDIREEGGVLSAKNAVGHVFLFASRGRRAALVFGKKDEAAARALLAAVLIK